MYPVTNARLSAIPLYGHVNLCLRSPANDVDRGFVLDDI